MFIPQLLCVSLSWTFHLVFLFMFIWLIFCFTLRFFFCVREIFVSCLSFHDLLLISAVDCVCVCTWPCLPFGLCVVCVVVSTFLVPDAWLLLLFVFWGFSTVFGCTARFKFAPSASCILSLLMISSQSYIVTPTFLINTHILLKLESISLLHRLR